MKKRMRKAVAIAATAAMVGSLPAGAVTAQAADLFPDRYMCAVPDL